MARLMVRMNLTPGPFRPIQATRGVSLKGKFNFVAHAS